MPPVLESKRLVEKREQLENVQKKMDGVMEQVGSEIDMAKLKKIGDEDVSKLSTVEKRDRFISLGKEASDLYDECMKIIGEDDTVRAHEKLRGLQHADPGDADEHRQKARPVKNLGQRIAEAEEYHQHFVKDRRGDGLTLKFDDLWLSDIIRPGMGFKTLFETSAGWDPRDVRLPGFTEAVARPIQLLDIIPMARVSTDTIQYMEETTRTHAAAEKAEGVAYAESTFELTENTANVRKVTDSLPVTDEQLADVPFVETYINGRLTFGIRQKLDGQVLIGSATPPAIKGIKNTSNIQTQATGADSAIDAFRKAKTKVAVTGRAMPTHNVVHSTDWEAIELTTTADGIYLLGSPTSGAQKRLWGLPVIEQEADSAGRGYVGSFLPMWISLFERQGIDVQAGYVNDDFTKGKKTVRASGRWALVVFRPAAFCEITGLS